MWYFDSTVIYVEGGALCYYSINTRTLKINLRYLELLFRDNFYLKVDKQTYNIEFLNAKKFIQNYTLRIQINRDLLGRIRTILKLTLLKVNCAVLNPSVRFYTD